MWEMATTLLHKICVWCMEIGFCQLMESRSTCMYSTGYCYTAEICVHRILWYMTFAYTELFHFLSEPHLLVKTWICGYSWSINAWNQCGYTKEDVDRKKQISCKVIYSMDVLPPPVKAGCRKINLAVDATLNPQKTNQFLLYQEPWGHLWSLTSLSPLRFGFESRLKLSGP